MADQTNLGEAFESLIKAGDRLDVIDEIREDLKRLADERVAERLAQSSEIKLSHRYNYGSLARVLDMKRASVRNISRTELPRCADGYVMGIDIFAYLGVVTYEQARLYKEEQRRRVTKHLSSSRSAK